MAWWVTVLIHVVGTLLYEVLRPKPKADAPTVSALGDFQFPTIGEGRPIRSSGGPARSPAPWSPGTATSRCRRSRSG